MEKYLAALVLSQQPTMNSDSTRPHSTMKSYLENVRNIKNHLLNNLSICATSVTIQEQTQPTQLPLQINVANKNIDVQIDNSISHKSWLIQMAQSYGCSPPSTQYYRNTITNGNAITDIWYASVQFYNETITAQGQSKKIAEKIACKLLWDTFEKKFQSKN